MDRGSGAHGVGVGVGVGVGKEKGKEKEKELAHCTSPPAFGSVAAIKERYIAVLDAWPQDPLRPEVSFQDAMRRRVERRFGGDGGVEGQEGDGGNGKGEGEGRKEARARVEMKKEEKANEMEQLSVLCSFLENRYLGKVGFFFFLSFLPPFSSSSPPPPVFSLFFFLFFYSFLTKSLVPPLPSNSIPALEPGILRDSAHRTGRGAEEELVECLVGELEGVCEMMLMEMEGRGGKWGEGSGRDGGVERGRGG